MPQAPLSIYLLRLSALGDVTHVVPLVRTLQAAWPQVALTWIIGKGEHRLLEGLPGVHFVEYDKKTGLAGMRALRRQLRQRAPDGRFDALLQMQVAARANLLSAFIPAKRRIGYDRSRSKDLHGLFINERIPDRPGIHVLDAIGSFCEPLGLKQTQVRWDLPVPDAAREWAQSQWVEDGRPTLLISPCSSHALIVTPLSPTTRLLAGGVSCCAVAAARWSATPPMPSSRPWPRPRWTW
jgi:heptosyltransferase I